ncbi:MAG: phage tail spike protein [Cetobacterium sp.]
MIPVLYNGNETNFEHKGIGVLKDTIWAKVEEERNGEFKLSLCYPITGRYKDSLEKGRIIKAKANSVQGEQLFRICRVGKSINGRITLEANHITFDLIDNLILNIDVKNATCQDSGTRMLQGASIKHNFTFKSDIPTHNNYHLERTNCLQAIGGTRGSLLDVYGGDILRDNYTISLVKVRGNNKQNIPLLKYGKNITGLESDLDITELVTCIYPYKILQEQTSGEVTPQKKNTTEEQKGKLIELAEKYIYAENSNIYPTTKLIAVDYSQEDSIIDEASLRAKALKYFTETQKNIPKVNYKIEFEELNNSTSKGRYSHLEKVNLCDYVLVKDSRLGIDVTARVIKYTYDVLLEKCRSCEIGDARSNLADNLNDVYDKVEDNKDKIEDDLDKVGDHMKEAIEHATSVITGNKGGYVLLYPKEHPSEIYILDEQSKGDKDKAKQVLRINNSGLGYSHNGINGQYETAITHDGHLVAWFIDTVRLNADKILTGSLRSQDGSVVINIGNGEFKFGGDSGAVTLTNSNVKVSHNDGSYSLLSATGLERMLSGQKFAYHHLVHVGVFNVSSFGNGDWTEARIQLPPEFRGKVFTPQCAIQGWYSPKTATIDFITTGVVWEKVDYANGVFHIGCRAKDKDGAFVNNINICYIVVA